MHTLPHNVRKNDVGSLAFITQVCVVGALHHFSFGRKTARIYIYRCCWLRRSAAGENAGEGSLKVLSELHAARTTTLTTFLQDMEPKIRERPDPRSVRQ